MNQPDVHYFDVMAEQARTHWWYEGRRHLVADLLGGRLPAGARVVDVGCGTGDNLAMLEAVGGGPVLGIELSEYAVAHAPRSAGRRDRALASPWPRRCRSRRRVPTS